MFSEEGYEKTYEWALRLIKEYPNCNMLIWQTAVMLDARRITDKCTNQEKKERSTCQSRRVLRAFRNSMNGDLK